MEDLRFYVVDQVCAGGNELIRNLKSTINPKWLDRCRRLNGGIPLPNAIMQRGEPSIELRDL